MSMAYGLIAIACVVVGLIFMALGAIGIVRLPDTYLRMHAATKCSTLGLGLLLLGAVFHTGDAVALAKSAMVIVFAFAAQPVGSHILAKAALRTKARQWRHTLSDEYTEDQG